MPTTFLGLVLFVALVAPGVCYLVRREARRGERKFSPLREIATVVLVGLVCDLAVISALAALRSFGPSITPDLTAFARNPAKYSTDHPVLVWWWSVSLLATACALGFALGGFSVDKIKTGKTQPDRLRRFLASRLGPVEFVSSWDKYMSAGDEEAIKCSLVLEDGSWLGGHVIFFNTDLEESQDRDLVLAGPVAFRPSGGTDVTELPDDLVVVSARRIIFMGLEFVRMGDFEVAESE